MQQFGIRALFASAISLLVPAIIYSPDAFVDNTLDDRAVKNLRVSINEIQGMVSSVPVYSGDVFDGAVIYIRTTKNDGEAISPKKGTAEELTFDSRKGRSRDINVLKDQA